MNPADETLKSAAASRIPVTVLSGCLVAGKMTLLKRVLNNREGRRVAAIANDMSEVTIDINLMREGSRFLCSPQTIHHDKAGQAVDHKR